MGKAKAKKPQLKKPQMYAPMKGAKVVRDMKSPTTLTGECGPHCGTITVGAASKHTAHCDCEGCHAGRVVPEVDPEFFMQGGEVDPRGIH